MSEYAPGTVAVATVRGVEGVRVFRLRSGWWTTGAPVHGDTWHGHDVVTDIRPLVVLDAPQVDLNVAAKRLRDAGFSSLADQIEAQTKPPRIPEPGLWGVVEANSPVGLAREWYRAPDGRWWPSACIGNERSQRWEDLGEPVLIREGVDS